MSAPPPPAPTRLVTAPERYSAHATTVLRELLQRAEAGEFLGLVVVLNTIDGRLVYNTQAAGPDYAQMIGQLHVLQHILAQESLGGPGR